MICKFGYAYSKDWNKGFNDAYLVVKNADYEAFIQAEIAISQHHNKNSEKFVGLVAEAAAYTGSLRKCPMCHRYLLILPDNDKALVLAREDE